MLWPNNGFGESAIASDRIINKSKIPLARIVMPKTDVKIRDSNSIAYMARHSRVRIGIALVEVIYNRVDVGTIANQIRMPNDS